MTGVQTCALPFSYVDTASSSIAANISLSININLTDITVTSEIPGGYISEEVSLV